jgi:hypothetical protein
VQDATYPNSLRLIDATQDFPLVHLEGAGHATAFAHSGGYALVRTGARANMPLRHAWYPYRADSGQLGRVTDYHCTTW